jgi:hypothetical protein
MLSEQEVAATISHELAFYEIGVQMNIDTFTSLSLRSTLTAALALGATRS